MTDVVTRLIVRADGSLATLDRFEKGMGDAGRATDYASGAVASFEKRMEAARAATERGLAVSTQSVARKSQEERAWEKWSATVDRTTGLRIRLEREAATAAAAAANAVNLGYASQEQALNTLMALERRHTAQLSAHIAAENNVAIAYNRTAQAADQAAASTARLSAANQNSQQYRGASNFNTANVAAQFQDVGVTAAMGMSPLMIALQQGTQLSAVLGGQGLTGVVKTLSAAFASILSPVSLLTIGVVALAAWGIQAFMNIANQGKAATRTLEDHKKWLDDLLVGYDAVAKAADRAATSAERMPEGVVRSDLQANLLEQEIASKALETRIQSARTQIEETAKFLQQTVDIGNSVGDGTAAIDAGLAQIQQIEELGLSSKNTAAELDQVMVAAIELYRSIDDPAIREMAKSFYDLALELRGVQAQAASTQAALAALANMDVQIKIQASTDSAVAAIDQLARLAPELRSAREQAQDALNSAIGSAPDAIIRQAAQTQYQQTIAALDEQDRRRAAEDAARKGATSGAKTIDKWSGNVDQFQQRIASQRMEIELLGQSTYEVERQKAAFDLLNQAKQSGIPITAEVNDQINLMSAEYASATVHLERMNQAANDNAAIWSQAQDGVSGIIKTWARGGDILENISSKLLNIGDMLVDMAVRDLFGGAFGGTGGMGGGGAGGGLFGWLGGLLGFSNGGSGVVGGAGSGTYSPGAPDNTLFVAKAQRGEPFAFGRQAVTGIGGASNGGTMHVSVGVTVDDDGKVQAYVKSISRQEAQAAAAAGTQVAVAQANKSAPASVAKYQQQRAGADYRTM